MRTKEEILNSDYITLFEFRLFGGIDGYEKEVNRILKDEKEFNRITKSRKEDKIFSRFEILDIR